MLAQLSSNMNVSSFNNSAILYPLAALAVKQDIFSRGKIPLSQREIAHKINSNELNLKLLSQLFENTVFDCLPNADCSLGLALGAAGAIVTQNPIPLGAASLNCLNGVRAVNDPQRFNGHIILEPGETWYMSLSQ